MPIGQSIEYALEHPVVYEGVQWILPFSSNLTNRFLRKTVRPAAHERLIDIGCGAGARARLFSCRYVGVDINQRYVRYARHRRNLDSLVMDCGSLAFCDGSFDCAVMVAMHHHVPDDLVVRSIEEARRVVRPGGAVHLIDAVWPGDGSRLKHFLFDNDRGRFQRSYERYVALVTTAGPVKDHQRLVGPMHDFCYVLSEH